MKNSKKTNRRVFLMLLMMLPTLMFLTTATYAWFTANKLVTISSIQVNVEAQGGIQISADGTNWKSIVNVEELKNVSSTTYAAAINQIPDTLEPVSSGATIDASGKMEMFYGSVSTNVGGDYILSSVKSTETADNADGLGKFVAFDLFFRADANTDLYLTTNSNVETPDAIDKGIKNSTRVAFVILGNTPMGSSIPTIQGLNAGVSAPKYIWEPNYNEHTAPAISHAFDTYGITVDSNPVPYSGIQAIIDVADNIKVGDAVAAKNPTIAKAMNPDYKTVKDFASNVQVFSLVEGITKIRLYMWIEGQDIDCENGASGGNATFNVQLSTDM